MSDARPLRIGDAIRSGPARWADLPAVGLAAGAWVGATVAAPVPAALALVAAVSVAVAARTVAPQLRWVLAGVVLALLTSALGARSLAGLTPPTTGDVEAEVTLVTDPEATATGRLRFEVRMEGRRLLAEASAPAAMAVLAPRLAGDRAVVRGVVEAQEDPPGWMVARHVAGRLRVESVVAVADGAPHAAAANGLRRILDRGASSLPDRHRALLAGLTLGDDRDQPAELAADFRASGLTHLLAVSGQNLVFILAVAGPVLRRLGIWPRFIVAVALVTSFAFLTRFEPSVVRAAAVATVALWATTSGRPSGGLRHLALAVAGLLVVDPLLTRSVGFRLSVTACLGVLLLAPPIVARLPGPRWVREALGMTTGAQLAVAPVLVPIFGAMPLAALPANVAAAPLAGALMVWGVTGGVAAGVAGGAVAEVLHLPSRAGLAALEHVAAVGGSLPLGHVDLRHIATVAAAALLVARGGLRLQALGAALVLLVVVTPATVRVPTGAEQAGWAATVWSDGPAAIVELEVGASGTEVLDVLRRRRVHVVSLVVVRAERPELDDVVDSIRARLPVQSVFAPEGSSVAGHVVPRAGLVVERAGFEVHVAAVSSTLEVRIGRAGAEPSPGRG